MTAFDTEVRTSLRAISVEAQKTKATVDGTNQSLRQTATTLSTVAAKHREAGQAATQQAAATTSLASKVSQVGQAATAAGGSSAGLVTRLGGLAAINPLALGVGAAIGFIATKASDAIEEVRDLNALLSDLKDLPAAIDAGVDAAGKKAMRETDVQAMRSRLFGESGAGSLEGVPPEQAAAVQRAAARAVETGQAKTTEEAVERMRKGGAFNRGAGNLSPRSMPSVDQLTALGAGMDDADPDALRRRIDRFRGDPRAQAATSAQNLQDYRRDRSERQQDALLTDANGVNSPGLNRVDAGVSGNPDAARILAEIAKKLEDNNAELRKLNAPGWHGPIDTARKAMVESRISELNAARTVAIQEAMQGYR